VRGSRTIEWLLRCYPPAWRARYGEELEALIVDMTGGRVPWRMRLDVIRSGASERLRAAGFDPGDPPAERARAGAVLVMWAWALFILGGAIVAKSTEHWQSAMPSGAGRAAASAAFTVLFWAAAFTGLVVLAGIVAALPSMARMLRDGGWRAIRARIIVAVSLTVALVSATIAMAAWAHGLAPRLRNGHDAAYGAAFLAWAVLSAATLLAWTSAAGRTAFRLRLPGPVLRLQALLACVAEGGMAVVAAATIAWWALVAESSPGALVGGPTSGRAPVIVPSLTLALALMLGATALGALGARRAAGAVAALD